MSPVRPAQPGARTAVRCAASRPPAASRVSAGRPCQLASCTLAAVPGNVTMPMALALLRKWGGFISPIQGGSSSSWADLRRRSARPPTGAAGEPLRATGPSATASDALRRRGSLTVWFDPSMPWEAIPSGRRGCQQAHGDAAMQTCLALKVLPGLPRRQGEPAKRHRIKPAGERFRGKRAGTVRARLLRARLRHPVMAAEAPRKPDGNGRDHSVPRFERRLAPARPLQRRLDQSQPLALAGSIQGKRCPGDVGPPLGRHRLEDEPLPGP